MSQTYDQNDLDAFRHRIFKSFVTDESVQFETPQTAQLWCDQRTAKATKLRDKLGQSISRDDWHKTFNTWAAALTSYGCFEQGSTADQALLKDFQTQRPGLYRRILRLEMLAGDPGPNHVCEVNEAASSGLSMSAEGYENPMDLLRSELAPERLRDLEATAAYIRFMSETASVVQATKADPTRHS